MMGKPMGLWVWVAHGKGGLTFGHPWVHPCHCLQALQMVVMDYVKHLFQDLPQVVRPQIVQTRLTISTRFWVSNIVLAPPSLRSISKAPCTSNEIVWGSIGTFGGQVPSGHVACFPLKVQQNEVVVTISMLWVSSIFHSFW